MWSDQLIYTPVILVDCALCIAMGQKERESCLSTRSWSDDRTMLTRPLVPLSGPRSFSRDYRVDFAPLGSSSTRLFCVWCRYNAF